MKKEKNIQQETIENQLDLNQTPEENEAKPEKKKSSKYIWYISIILVITGLVLYFSLKDSFFETVDVIATSNWVYLIYAGLAFLGVFLLNSLIIYLFARKYKKKYYFHQAMANDCIGNLYNCITPGATGGQIMQAYTYKKQGISISNATSCLVMNFIVYQTTLIVFSVLAVCFKFNDIMAMEPFTFAISGQQFSIPLLVFVMLGFILQVLVVGLTIGMSYWKGLHNFVLKHGVNFLAKIKIIKNPDETRRKFGVQIESYKIELKNLVLNPRFLILIVLLQVGVLFLRFTIPYFTNIAVVGNAASGISYNTNYIDTVLFTCIQKMSTELIPIPGGAGVSEFFFYQLFAGSFSGENSYIYTNATQLIWRTITFHIPLVVSGVVGAFYKAKPSKEEIYQVGEGHVTYVTLQMATIEERKKDYETIFMTREMHKKDTNLFPFIKKKKKNIQNENEEKNPTIEVKTQKEDEVIFEDITPKKKK